MTTKTDLSLLFVMLMVFSAMFLGLVVGSDNGMLIAVLLLPVVVVTATVRDFRFGVGVLMMLMPIASTKIMPHKLFGITGINPVNLALIGTLLSFLLLIMFKRERSSPIPWRMFLPFILALALATFLGSSKISLIPGYFYLNQESLYTTAFQYARDEFIKPLLTLASVWLISVAVSRSKIPDRWLTLVSASVISLPILVIVVVLLSGYGLRDLASPTARSFLSVTGLHANQLAVVLIPAFSAALFMLPAQRTFSAKVFGMAVIGAVLLALLLTFSRAAFLGVILVTVVFFFLRGQVRYIIFGGLVFLAAALVMPDTVVERATRGFESGSVGGHNDPLTAGRVGGIWMPLLPEIAKHLILGDGVNATMWSEPSRAMVFVEGHPHNAYLRLLMDHGIVGGALIFYFLLQIWRLFRRLSRDETMSPLFRAYYQGISVAFVVFLVQCMSGSRLLFDSIHVFFWFAIGIGLGLEQIKTNQAAATKLANNSVLSNLRPAHSPAYTHRV